MNEEQRAALDKIKKLLRMKRGGTPDEIATALRLAQELAAKHGIDLAAVDPDQEERERPLGHEHEIHGARIQWECKYAMLIAEQFFNVTAFINRFPRICNDSYAKCITFVGNEWDRQIAIYVYKFLVRHFRSEWREKRGRLRNRQAFLHGMYLGVGSKLRERQPKKVEGEGLVLLEREEARRDKYVSEKFGQTESSSVQPHNDSDKARWSGWIAGRDTEIRRPLGDANEQGQRLLS